LTATHSSTLAEEVVGLLRTLHSLTQWNGLINKYINSQLCSVTQSYAGKTSERVCFMFSHKHGGTLAFKLSFKTQSVFVSPFKGILMEIIIEEVYNPEGSHVKRFA
jgi:hypothetical protein